MNHPLINIELVRTGSALNSLVLTPNQRIARKIIQAAQWQDGKQVECWESPAVESLNDWIRDCWTALQNEAHPVSDCKILLSELEMTNVWARIIGDDPAYESILNGLELASLALSAERTLMLWEANPGDFVPDSLETERFLAWRNQVHLLCAAKNWVSFEEATAIVIQAVADGTLTIPSHVVLMGFDETPPLVERLFRTLEEAGELVMSAEPDVPGDNHVVKVQVLERQQQALAAAQWARAQLDHDPKQRIAIVCPELAKQKDVVEAAFRRVFEPQSFLIDAPRYTSPFNISAGSPLAKAPIIEAILSFLSAPGKRLSINDLSTLILSPFIRGGVSERVERHRFIRRLKKSRLQRVALFDLLQYVDIPKSLSESLSKAHAIYSCCPPLQNLSQWAFWINSVCEALGWPGDRGLDSEEYQALQQWNKLLDDYSSLEKIYSGCSPTHAIGLLRQCASGRVFKPESHDSPIQILGALEAAGLSFDQVWVMDLNDDIWPPAPDPSPFIPLYVQRDQEMPHATAERELNFSKRIFNRLTSSGKTVVLSHAMWEQDRELRASTLLDHTQAVSLSELESIAPTAYASLIKAEIKTEQVEEVFVPVGQQKVRGGVGIFTSQSRCPFQAFAKYRLKAGEAPDNQPGLTPAERGKVIHDALEHFWQEVENHEQLANMSDEVLDLNIEEAVDHGLFLLKNSATTLGNTILRIERQRTVDLIKLWLHQERARAPFKVLERETTVEAEIGGMQIKIRIDRIDEMESGQRLAIDYKTGRADIREWIGDRPDNLQMPVYAVSDKADGVAIASLRKDDVKMRGIITSDATDGLLDASALPERLELPNGWDNLKEHWQATLERLGGEYQAGVNTLTPSHPKHCRTCQYQPICRKTR